MEENNFLDALDDWGTILTNTYEDASNTSITLTPSVCPKILEYIIEEYPGRDVLTLTNNRIDYIYGLVMESKFARLYDPTSTGIINKEHEIIKEELLDDEDSENSEATVEELLDDEE